MLDIKVNHNKLHDSNPIFQSPSQYGRQWSFSFPNSSFFFRFHKCHILSEKCKGFLKVRLVPTRVTLEFPWIFPFDPSPSLSWSFVKDQSHLCCSFPIFLANFLEARAQQTKWWRGMVQTAGCSCQDNKLLHQERKSYICSTLISEILYNPLTNMHLKLSTSESTASTECSTNQRNHWNQQPSSASSFEIMSTLNDWSHQIAACWFIVPCKCSKQQWKTSMKRTKKKNTKWSPSAEGHTFASLNRGHPHPAPWWNPAMWFVSGLTSCGSTDAKGTTSQRTPCLYNNVTCCTPWAAPRAVVNGWLWVAGQEACRDVNHISVYH